MRVCLFLTLACAVAPLTGCRGPIPEEKWELAYSAKCEKIVRLVVERPRGLTAGATDGSVTAEAVSGTELLVFRCPRSRMRVLFDVPAGQASWLVMTRHEVEWNGRGYRYSLEVHVRDEVEYNKLLVESGSPAR